MPDTQFVAMGKNWMGQPEVKAYAMSGFGYSDSTITTVDIAYRFVPWFRRSCKHRANQVGRFPISLETANGTEVSEDPAYQGVMNWTRSLLYHTEMSKVKYGAAYHLLEANRFGLNVTPRFIPTPFVTPLVNYQTGLTGFRVSFIPDAVPLDKMVYIWEPNEESETAPGSSDGEAALRAAGLMYAINEMANRYMKSGAVPVTAVKVPASVSADDRERVGGWMERMASGFRNAFKFLVVSDKTEFEQIGSEMKDIQSTELTDSQRKEITVALGVPPTVIDGTAANFATADAAYFSFMADTIIPEVEFLEPLLNEQLYSRLGLTLRFKPDELEIMQTSQLQQAERAQALTGGKQVISVNEARDVMGYEEIPQGDWSTPTPTPAPAFGASMAASAPMMEAPSAGSGSDETVMKAWLDQSLAAHKGGSPATVGAWFDDELESASSANMVKRIYAAHWPKPQEQSWQRQAVAELARFNALAEGVSHHG